MGTQASHFFARPGTSAGWWSTGLTILFVILFYLVSNDILNFPGRLTIGLGIIAGIVTLIALILKRERSWLVWLMLLPGLFAIVFALGEVLSPH